LIGGGIKTERRSSHLGSTCERKPMRDELKRTGSKTDAVKSPSRIAGRKGIEAFMWLFVGRKEDTISANSLSSERKGKNKLWNRTQEEVQ